MGFSIFTLWRNIQGENWGNAAFAGFNAIAATSAIISYIGLGNLLTDIWFGVTDWLFVEVKPKNQQPSTADKPIDWRAVLYHGDPSGTLPHHTAKELLAVRNTSRRARS